MFFAQAERAALMGKQLEDALAEQLGAQGNRPAIYPSFGLQNKPENGFGASKKPLQKKTKTK